MQQLSLFAQPVVEIKDVTIEWLYNHINMLYPQFAFAVTKSFLDGTDKITQTISKKIDLQISVGKFDSHVACIGGQPYIRLYYGKNYGTCEHSSRPCLSTEEFLERLEYAAAQCEEFLNEKGVKNAR